MNEFLNSIKSNVKSFEAPFKHWEFYKVLNEELHEELYDDEQESNYIVSY